MPRRKIAIAMDEAVLGFVDERARAGAVSRSRVIEDILRRFAEASKREEIQAKIDEAFGDEELERTQREASERFLAASTPFAEGDTEW